MKRKKYISIFAGILVFLLTISNIQPVKAETFSQGNQYQSGGYDLNAVQPAAYNWTRQSEYSGPENGTEKWSFQAGGRIGTSSPAIGSDGTIYIGSWDNNLYAINSDGTKKWSYATGGIINSSPVIGSDGTIYVGSEDNKLYAVNPDGTLKWTYTTWYQIDSSPAIGNDGTIYASSRDGNLYAINPSDGKKKWIYTTNGQIASSPAIGSDGTIYVGSYDKNLYAISPNGTKKWAYATGDNIFLSSPTIGTDGTIYVGSYDNNLYAINPDGTKKWSCPTGARIDSTPAIGSDGTIYVGSYDCKLHAVGSDGTEKWAYATGGIINSSPTIDSNGTIYVGSDDNKLYAINPDGTKRWSYATYWTIDSSPAIGSDGIIYIGSYDSCLYAIKTAVFASTTDSSISNDISTLGLEGTSAASDHTDIVTAAINTTTGKIDITSVAVGTAAITITDASGHTATIPVTVNADGSITIGDISKYEVPAASAPSAPYNVTATAGNASVSLAWTAPDNDGGSAITDYKIDVYANGSIVKTVDTGLTTPSATISGLINGTGYTFDVKAVNAIGDGTPSAFTNMVTPTAPGRVAPGSGSSSAPVPAEPKIVAVVVDEEHESKTVSAVNAVVTANTDGTDTVKFKASDAIVMKQPDGTTNAFEDYSKVGYDVPSATPVKINSDGTVQIDSLAKGASYSIPVTYDLGGGQKITIGNMHISVDNAGNVSMNSDLIDPYGILTDSLSGKAIANANVVLYYADTARNRAAGKIPGTMVQLPVINGFKPNDNKNPQMTDSNGSYGYMVYPDTDYYIVAKKDGYDIFTSPSIAVGTELVKFSAKMNPQVKGVKRIAGGTRIDTAIEIAKSEFTGKVNSVVLATADNYPDALTGSVLAYKQNAPILLVGDSQEDKNKLLTYMKNYLSADGKVFLLGGTEVVTENFAAEIKAAGYSDVIRLGGADRYETSAKIADYLNVTEGTPVVIASGENYPDALSAGSVAAINQYPILLVANNTISDSVKSELAKIKPSKVYIIGGQGVISKKTENEIAQLSGNIVRLGGADRYSTSIIVANNFKLSGRSVCIAAGTNFPDALAGTIYAANYNAPMILVGNTLTDEEKTYIKNSRLSGAAIFGGEGSVNDKIANEITGLLSK